MTSLNVLPSLLIANQADQRIADLELFSEVDSSFIPVLNATDLPLGELAQPVPFASIVRPVSHLSREVVGHRLPNEMSWVHAGDVSSSAEVRGRHTFGGRAVRPFADDSRHDSTARTGNSSPVDAGVSPLFRYLSEFVKKCSTFSLQRLACLNTSSSPEAPVVPVAPRFPVLGFLAPFRFALVHGLKHTSIDGLFFKFILRRFTT